MRVFSYTGILMMILFNTFLFSVSYGAQGGGGWKGAMNLKPEDQDSFNAMLAESHVIDLSDNSDSPEVYFPLRFMALTDRIPPHITDGGARVVIKMKKSMFPLKPQDLFDRLTPHLSSVQGLRLPLGAPSQPPGRYHIYHYGDQARQMSGDYLSNITFAEARFHHCVWKECDEQDCPTRWHFDREKPFYIPFVVEPQGEDEGFQG